MNGPSWPIRRKQSAAAALIVFVAAVVFVFLVLAAQYESWSLPLAVILIVPMCLLASVTGLLLAGLDVNILAQIGFVVLVGLAAKNAILIVEFARQAEEEGASPTDAAVGAAQSRLRPILMTSLAFILGVVPLVIAAGAGRGDAPLARHRGVLRHAGRDPVRAGLHAGLLCGAEAPGSAPAGRDQRRAGLSRAGRRMRAAARSSCASTKKELKISAAISPCSAQPNSIKTKVAASTKRAMPRASACAAW